MKRFLLLLLFVLFVSGFGFGQCGVEDTLINIPDNEVPIEFQLVVDGVQNNNLASPSQCVKRVSVHYDHSSRHDLTIDLVSPAGQKVGLVGPFVDIYLLTGYIEWDISFVPDGDLAAPDDFQKSDHFNNNDNWFDKGNAYDGVYYPNSGSLEDFNTGSVNGTWTFIIHDHDNIYDGHFYGATIEFCDGSTINCDVCRADAGSFEQTDYAFCEDNPDRLVDLDVVYNGQAPNQNYYNYDYLIYKDNKLIDISNNPRIDTFSIGSYNICGLSYSKGDSTGLFNMMNAEGIEKFVDSIEIVGTPYCADITDTCISLKISRVADQINIDTSICYGDTLYFDGEKMYEDGQYYISLPSYNCEKSYLIDLKVWNLDAGISADNNTIKCPVGFVTLTGEGYFQNEGMSFKWSDNVVDGQNSTSVQVSEPGVYDFIVIGDNCSDTASIEIFIDVDVPQLQFDIGTINCFSDQVDVSVSSDNVVLDEVLWWDEQGNQYKGETIKTSNPGFYEVKATSTNQCYVLRTIEVPIDTVKPRASLSANVITCNSDTSFINFDSSDPLIDIEWRGIGKSSTGDIFVLDSGWYYVEYQSDNGCVSLDSIYVEAQLDAPDVSIYYDTLTCLVSQAEVGANTSETNLDYLWIAPNGDSIKEKSFFTALTGNYKYEITGQNGCKSVGDFDITIDTVPVQLTFSSDVLYINCDSATQIKYTADDSLVSVICSGPADYTSTTDPYPTIEYEGVYELSVMGENGCVSSYPFTVLYDTLFSDIEIIPDSIDCKDSEANLSAKHDASKNYTFEWKDSNDSVYPIGDKITAHIGGYFYLTVTDNDSGCKRVFYTEVPFDDTELEISLSTSNALDCSHDSVVISLESNIDLELDSLHWTGNGIDIYTDTIIEVTSPGFYYVEALGVSKCGDKDSIYIAPEETIELSADTFFLNCENDTMVQLQLKGVADDSEFSWKGPNLETSDPSPLVTEEGLYNVIVKKGHCIDTTDILVKSDLDAPALSVEFDQIIPCDLNYSIIKATLDTTGLPFYALEGPNGYQNKVLVDTVYGEGQYLYRARANNGCESLFIMDISKSSDYPTVVPKGDTINCIRGIHDLVVEADIEGNYNFVEWTGPNGYTSNDIQSVVPEEGWYNIFVNNDKNCIVLDSAYVLVDTASPVISLPIIDTITCKNESVEIPVGTSDVNNTFEWAGPLGFSSEDSVITVFDGGEYVLNVTGTNGCVLNQIVEVPINKLKPYIFLNSKNLDGNNSKVTIDLSTSASDFTVSWSGPNGFSSTDEDVTINVEGMYYVSLIDEENGCQAEDSITVIWDTIPPSVFSQDYYLPCDTSIYIEMVAFSEISGCEFYWSGPEDFYQVGPTAYTNVPGEYIITAKGPNGIFNHTKINVFDIPIYPEFDAFGDNLDCYSDSGKVRAVGVDDDAYFEWIGPNGFHSDKKEFFADEPGVYTLIVTGKNSCVDSLDLEITIDSIKPVIQVDGVSPLACERIQDILNADVLNDSLGGVYSFSWSTNDGKIVQGNNSKNPLIEGEGYYKVKVLNTVNGCFDTDSVFVQSDVYSLDSGIINIVSPTCYGYKDGFITIDSVFGGEAPYTYSLDNYWFSDNNSFNSKEAGEYVLYVKDANGCKLDTNVVIPEGAQVQVVLGADKDSIFLGDVVNLEAVVYSKNPIAEYYWTPDKFFDYQNDSTQSISLVKSVNITVEAVDDKGCSDVSSLWIRVKAHPDVFIPNIFSPNGDGLNDYFYIKSGAGVKGIKKLIIYDRWGNMVFEKQNPRQNVSTDGWDGKCNGLDVLSGVYVYTFIIELNNGDLLNLTGDITLTK